MARRSQPSRLRWPLTAEQLERIDDMFQELYDDTDNGSLELDADQITAGALDPSVGGTGISSYVIGDLLYASDTDVLSTLAGVATGNALISGGVATAPSWGKIGLTTHVDGVLPVANGGTNIASYAVGDLIYASAATTLSKLAAVAAGAYLRSAGVTTAPVWSTLILPNAGTIGDIPQATSANTLTMLASVSAGSYLRSAGVGTANVWSTVKIPNTATIGDLWQATASNSLAALASVAAGSYLRSAGVATANVWSTLTLPNASSQGDIFYSSAANAMTVLAKNTTATRYLSNTGASNNPAWAQVDLSNGVTGTLPLANGGTAVSSATQTYTPSLTNVTNVGASTAYACQYMRVGNTVIVSGKVDIDPTAAGATELGLSLPVASNFATEEQLGGTAQTAAVAGEGIAIRADTANDRAALVYTAVDVTNKSWFFTFAYQVL